MSGRVRGLGAKLTHRCVRCGVPKPPVVPWSELQGEGASVQAHGRDGELIPRAYRSRVMVGRLRDHELFIGQRGALLSPPHDDVVLRFTDPKMMVMINFDHDIADKDYWWGIRKELFALIPSSSECGALLWKRVKEYRGQAQAKSWEDVLPPTVAHWAQGELDKESKDDDCVDNYRVACVSSTPQMRRYRSQKASGCCGSQDFKRRGPDGKRYVLGFNYGH